MMLSVSSVQVIRYYSCGAAALAIDLSLFRASLLIGLAPWVAAGSSYVIAACVHFVYNRIWTFNAIGCSVAAQALRYGAVVGTGCGITVVLVSLLIRDVHVDPFYAKLAAVAAVSPLAFFAHKYITYRSI